MVFDDSAPFEGTILVVEDDPGVRDVAVQMLNMAGFTVIEAEDAGSGLAKFKRYPEIDLVFTDVILPGGVSGIEMTKDILKHKPHTLILLATGYEAKAAALQDLAARVDTIRAIKKPYDVNKIPGLINSMIATANNR